MEHKGAGKGIRHLRHLDEPFVLGQPCIERVKAPSKRQAYESKKVVVILVQRHWGKERIHKRQREKAGPRNTILDKRNFYP